MNPVDDARAPSDFEMDEWGQVPELELAWLDWMPTIRSVLGQVE